MPIRKVKGGWRIGSGRATYKTKRSADRAYSAYRAKRHAPRRKR